MKKYVKILTLKESDVYSPNRNANPMCESGGVEYGFGRSNFYKHEIPPGFALSNVLYVNHFAILMHICIFFLFCSCVRQGEVTVLLSDLPAIHLQAELDGVVEIKNWMAIGPFGFNPLLTDPVQSFSRKDLKRYGITEGLIDGAAIEKLQKRGVNVFPINAPSPQIKLFNYVFDRVEKKSNFYLVCRIYAEKKQDVTLIIDGSYSFAAWLNGDKLVEVRGKHNVNKAGDRFINASLKAGENLLFVKANRGTNVRSWDLICAIASRNEGERIFRVNYAGDFVVNPIVHHSLEVYAGPYLNGKVEIMDENGQTVAAGSFENQYTNDKPFAVSGLNRLAEGFYRTVLTVGNEKVEQMIYKGDYTQFVKKSKEKVDGYSNSSLYAKDLKAALQRIEYLHSRPGDPNSPSETRFLNRNRVFWGYALHRMFQQNAETQLMTYDSPKGDSGVFIFHHNTKQAQQIPLVIIVPSALQGSTMIEDWYTSNLDQIETDNALADRYGFAVAWIYADGRNYSAVKTEREIAAVLDRLRSDYLIDPDRIFITGDCEGGRRALVQLAASPGRYAACVAASPITLSGGADGTPVNLIPQMGNVPILIRHGTDDDVSPVENSRRFYAEAQKLNLPVEYVEVEGSHIHVAKDGHRYVFEFFSSLNADDAENTDLRR